MRFMMDSGSSVNLLPASLVSQLGSAARNVRRPESKLRMFDGTLLQTDGMVTLPVTHLTTGQLEQLDFYIATRHKQPLIGIEACLMFDLMNINYDNICAVDIAAAAAAAKPLTMAEVKQDYADVFEGYGRIEGKVSLKADTSVQPVRMPLRKLPIPIRDRVAKELQHLEASGIIARVTEPTPWISSLLVTAKAKGDLRVCIDPTPLNRALLRDHHYMPGIDDILPMKRVKDIVYALKGQFARHGSPSLVMSDCSPFLAREFQEFAKTWDFVHQTSSPRYPQSNGKVERAIQVAKSLMQKAVDDRRDPFLAVLEFRNTPSERLQLSPVQIIFGRRTRSLIPIHSTLLQTDSSQQTRSRLMNSKAKQTIYYNRKARSPRPPLEIGQTVRFKQSSDDEWRKGEIADKLPFRSYRVRVSDGSTLRRTSRHVRFSAEPPIVMDYSELSPTTECKIQSPTPMPPAGTGAAVGTQRQSSRDLSTSPTHATPSTNAMTQPAATKTRCGRTIIKPARYR